MGLPNQLIPSPVLTSTVELRFKTSVDKAKILPLMFESFYKTLSDFSETGIPSELKEGNEVLKYYPDYILKNDEFALSFSDKALSFENINGYRLWNNYFSFIKDSLSKIYNLNIFDCVERIGIRYSSFFEMNDNKIEDIFNYVPKLALDDYKGDFFSFSTNLFIDDYRLLIQLNNNHIALKNGNEVKGVLVDIDASYTTETGNLNSFDNICEIVNDLHSKEKDLFFALIKRSFLEKEFQIN